MDIHLVDIVIHIVNIVVLFVVLRILLYKPVKKFMQAREDRLKAEKQEVIDSRAETEELKKQYEEKLADAQNEAKNIIRESGEKAQAQGAQIIREAEDKAAHILSDAEIEAQKVKDKAAESMKQDVVSAAADMASKILSREVNEKDNADIADKFFSELESK